MQERGKKTKTALRGRFSNKRALLIVVLILGISFTTLAIPQKAQAFPGEALAAAAWKEIRDSLRYLRDNLNALRKNALKTAADISYKNTLRLYLARVAQDTAVWVASAGTGQKPLFITDPNYFRNLNDAAVGDFVARMSTNTFGVTVRDPGTPQGRAAIQQIVRNLHSPANGTQSCNNFCLQLNSEREQKAADIRERLQEVEKSVPDNAKIGEVEGPEIDCPVAGGNIEEAEIIWTPENGLNSGGMKTSALRCHVSLTNALDRLKVEATTTFKACQSECTAFGGRKESTASQAWSNLKVVEVGSAVSSYYSLDGNDFGIALKLYQDAAEAGQQQEQAARDITPVGGLKPIVSPVSGEQTVPSTLVETKAQQPIEQAGEAEKIKTGSPVADAIGVFSNTLVQKLTERFFKGKCGFNPAACKGPTSTPGLSDLGSLLFGGGRLTGVAAARQQFASLEKIAYVVGTPTQSRISSVEELTGDGIIDSRFAQAIEERLTVQEAIDKGLLEGSRIFGFDSQRNDATQGYGYRSILYLRRARIVPVGWELAALYIRDYAPPEKTYTLQELVNGYLSCDDGVEGVFCGLVDPNWVLKAPEQFCRRAGAADEIISREFVCDEDTNNDGRINCSNDPIFGGDIGRWLVQREANSCVDVQDCIVEKDDGSCLAFGYCFEEKPVWRFDGEQCAANFASCLSYENPDGTIASYLSDTVNVDSCTAENAGCLGYCDGNAYWGTRNEWTCGPGTENFTYFDRDAEVCRSDEAGCREYIRTTNGTNLIPNSSFEHYLGDIDDNAEDSFLDWTGTGRAVSSSNVSMGENNFTAVEIAAGNTMKTSVDTGTPLANQNITFSYSGRTVSGNCSGEFSVKAGSFEPAAIPVEYTPFWRQFSATFTINEGPFLDESVELTIGKAGCDIQVDTAQLTLGASQQPYTDYGTTNRIFLDTAAPNEIANADFSNDAGKDFYPDWTDDNDVAGDGKPDGYLSSATGVEIDTAYGYDDTTSIRLDASGGNTWVGQDVAVTQGEEFIVSGWVKTALSGGYGTIRTECVDAAHGVVFDDACELWSETSTEVINPQISGTNDWTYVQYRIRANLSNIAYVRVLCYNLGGTGSVWCDNLRLEEAPPSLLCATEDVGCELYTSEDDGQEIPGIVTAKDSCPADQVGCRAYREVGISQVPVRPTVDPVNLIASTGQTCAASAVGCEEYTNLDMLAQGGEALAYYSRIKQCVTPDHPDAGLFYSWVGTQDQGYQLRKWNLLNSNVDGGPCTNISVGSVGADPVCEDDKKPQATCSAAELLTNPDCVEFFDTNANPYYRLQSRTVTVSDQCQPYRNTVDDQQGLDTVYYILASEATQCAPSQAFCREYKGATGSNDFVVFSDNFEDGDAAGWSPTNISFESLSPGGHSLWTGSGTSASYDVSSLVQNGQSYLVRLWAKGFGTSIQASFTGTNGTVSSEPALLTQGEWNTYTLGPMFFDHVPAAGEELRIDLDGGGFIDNVELIANVGSTYLIQGTADSCGAENVNCTAYRDRSGETKTVKSFTRLCSQEAVGCEALIDTQNSESPFATTVQNITTPKDRVVSVINDPRRECAPSSASCEAFGLPAFTSTGDISSFETVYFKNDPDQYQNSLCSAEALFCEEFRIADEQQGAAYFKEPLTTACDYRVGENYQGETVTGWFKTDTTEPCPSYNLWCDISGTPTPANTATQVSTCIAAAADIYVYPTSGFTPTERIFCTTDSRLDCTNSTAAAQCLTQGGRCAFPGPPSATCVGGDEEGSPCRDNSECTGGGACTGVYTGLCTAEASGCNAYRDPLDPVGCEVQCPRELDANGNDVLVNGNCDPDPSGVPGCQSYTYIRSSVEDRSTECNNTVDFELGCRPFYDASNPNTLFKSN